jgi:predicted metalloprotease with PDZ domain
LIARRAFRLAPILLVVFLADAHAQTRYTLDLAQRAQHLVHVTMSIPGGPDERSVQLPVWNALYQVRDFSQYVRDVIAKDTSGTVLPIHATDKTTWRIANAARGATIEYDFLAELPPPFGIEVTDQHAFFNFAEILMYEVGARDRAVEVRIVNAAPGWELASALLPNSTDPRATLRAENYDRLVDSPVELGVFQQYSFRDDYAAYSVVVDGNPADYDSGLILDQLKKITHFETSWMDGRPFDHYLFIYHFPRGPAGGGMEHAYSTAISVSSERIARDPLAVADVSAHEFFHLWNVKRIRPQCLEPIDYTKEQYCTALWFSEGVTSTVGQYTLLRTRLIEEPQFLRGLADEIQDLQSRPAHRTQSVEESSLETWYDKYPAYGLPVRSISYYNKGYIDGVLLDLAILDATSGRKSLRDVFLYLNDRYAKQHRFFADSGGVREAVEAVSGRDFRDFFARYVAGTDEIPYDNFFRTVGLQLEVKPRLVGDAGLEAPRAFNAPRVVASVIPGSPAQAAGVRVGDVVVSVNGKPVTGSLDALFASMKPGSEVRLQLSTRGSTHEVTFKLGSREVREYALVEVPHATDEQRARRKLWLYGDTH